METYGWAVVFLCMAVFPLAMIAGIVHAVCIRSPRYLWIWGCLMGFCFFTTCRHLIVLIAYDDIADPNYGIYKDWDVYRLILSDVLRLTFWAGMGVLSCFAFIRKKRILREVVLCVWIVFLAVLAGPVLAMAALHIFGRVLQQIGQVMRQLR